MKNESFCRNKAAYAKGIVIVGAVAAALSAVLLFVVCQTAPVTPAGQFCRHQADQTFCWALDPKNPIIADEAACAANGGTLVVNCSIGPTPAECGNFPSASGCAPCDASPSTTPGCPAFCQIHQSDPSCSNPDQCNVTTNVPATCPVCQVANPPQQCQNYVPDPCVANTSLPQCANPNLCNATNPAPTCPNYCSVFPTAAQCVNPDPCNATNPAPTCSNYCSVFPTAAQCVNPDPCNVTTNVPATCPDCNVANPPQKCQNYVPPTTEREYCSWGGGATCVEKTPSTDCSEGDVVSVCPTIPTNDLGYCKYSATSCHAATRAHCANSSGEFFQGDNSTCEGGGIVEPGEGVCTNSSNEPLYCMWESGCYAMDSRYDEEERECPAIISACQSYGFVSKLSDCGDYVEPSEKYYCWWDGSCSEIKNPNDVDPNSPENLTKLANCETNSLPRMTFPTMDACNAYTPPATIYYCDWGGAGNCWNMGAGTQACSAPAGETCSGTQMEHCTANGTAVITCTGTDRPSDGSCCRH